VMVLSVALLLPGASSSSLSLGLTPLRLETLALAESDTVRQLEELYTSIVNGTNYLKRTLEEWRETDFEAVLPEDSPSHFRQLSEKRFLLKFENSSPDFYRARIALAVRMASIADAEEDERREGVFEISKETLERRNKMEEYRKMAGGSMHPIDAFLFIKRITKTYMASSNALMDMLVTLEDMLTQLTNMRDSLGLSGEDLTAAAEGLLLLQETYHLNTSHLARGFVQDGQTSDMDG
ncbi:uncharacterized protein LOC125178355, partial [Hyalella azteca]|uniref:Uncharacterized protein LOC125178355 n=1 Tax=Hyalella azteca TaxID=294128 RepID=A0A979FLE8_HYAAZ